ncbi:hypothetical protein Syun_027548 [Stephania yunnanensis]|uniref:Uncharacterized protein n=1 Tax=Stephania yunnanensis TaxID=152371 RepID=A0AAP0HQ20_9MAGN
MSWEKPISMNCRLVAQFQQLMMMRTHWFSLIVVGASSTEGCERRKDVSLKLDKLSIQTLKNCP